MAANGSGRPPETSAVIILGLIGLFSTACYETRRDSQTLSVQASEPLPKKEAAFCPFHVDLEKQPSHWPSPPISKSEQ
jgi:hypothetical protein